MAVVGGAVIVTATTGLTTAAPGLTPAARADTPQCPTVTTTTVIASPGPDGWAENLVVADDGSLWVSRSFRNVVERYDASGRRTASVSLNAPGSIRQGPDGQLYVATGDSPTGMLPGAPRTGTVVRFDPRAAQPVPQVFARGLGMPNGLAVGADRAVYLADGALGLLRLRPDGQVDPDSRIDEAWSRTAPQNLSPSTTVNGTGINGVTILGDDLYVTMTVSATGRVLRVPVDDPAATVTAADLTAPAPGFLDDLVAIDDSTLAVASTTGQVHLVNIDTGQACSITVGVPVTALATDPAHPGTLLAASETGQILRLSPRSGGA
jgi:sugar lactone lactonase YvrE